MKPFDCDTCGTPIGKSEAGTWMKVTGWVEVKKGGTVNDKVHLPSSPVAFRCLTCMMVAQLPNRGQQDSLF